MRPLKALAASFLVLCVVLLSPGALSKNNSQGPGQRQIDVWLDYDFDPRAPMGSPKNPAIVLTREMALVVGDLPGSRRQGNVVFVPAAELKRAVNVPLAGALLAPVVNQLSNIKSFDGFSAVDGTSLLKKAPSLLFEPQNAIGRRLTGSNPEQHGRLLRNGDIVFGSHLVNIMTWGRFNHVAIVTDASRGVIIESTASVPSDRPGVRTIDWKSFAANYMHVAVARVRGASPEQLARVIRWVEARKGKPYRWPIIMGLNTTDESRFYCSQLVWLAFKQELNIDLDYDKGVLIFPDDIYYSTQYVDHIVP
ncbi:MAG TPA: YiiX/YebB-like N1pC/P60 family cysteine hydrolase [Pyrinomonadaceae bacterium]|nr:YiiX/YebB-like N1pC/P60 family cysteine hydrolase [Pyrinomonadaceae bacterium]